MASVSPGHIAPVDEFPLFLCRVSAGFPSPAEEYREGSLNLNRYVIRHPAATFFVRAAGDSMLGAGIHPEDLLVVDRSLEPADGRVVVAAVNGELTVKRLSLQRGKAFLLPENKTYPPLEISSALELQIWGVVTFVLHAL